MFILSSLIFNYIWTFLNIQDILIHERLPARIGAVYTHNSVHHATPFYKDLVCIFFIRVYLSTTGY